MSMSMRHMVGLAVLLLSFAVGDSQRVQAQQSEEFRITSFDGGRLDGDVRLGSNVFGAGLGAGSFGRVHSALGLVDGAALFGNPSHLSFVNKPQLGIEFRFPIHNGSFGLGPESFWTDSSIRRKADGWLADLEYPQDASPTYTRVSRLYAGQPRQLSAFWLNWPVSEHVSIGFGYRQPLIASLGARLDGFTTQLNGRQQSNLGFIGVEVLSELAGSVNANLSFDEISIGTGGLLERYYFGSVWWGISFFRYDAGAHLDLDAVGHGYVSVAGSDTRYFNDPVESLPEGGSNELFWRMRADYTGAGFGARVGFVHRSYTERFGTSVLFTVPPVLRLNDPEAMATSRLPEFLVLDGTMAPSDPNNAELLDIDRINLAQPNATRQSRDYLGSDLTLRMPAQIMLGFDLRFGEHTLVVNGTRHFGSLSMEGNYGRENGVIQPFQFGKQPSWGFRAGLDLARTLDGRTGILWIPIRILTLDVDGLLFELFDERTGYGAPRYRFAGGFTWGDAITEGAQDTIAPSLSDAITSVSPISFSLGRTYDMGQRTHVGVHVAGFPDLLWRFSLAFDVD